jgi:hypothetical protein
LSIIPPISRKRTTTLLVLILIYTEFDETLSDWLLLNTNPAIFQLYHSENKLHFNEKMFSLY